MIKNMVSKDFFAPHPSLLVPAQTEVKIINSSIIPGLSYYPNFISRDEEIELLEIITSQQWLGDLKRRVQHYGWKYNYKAKTLNHNMWLGPLPDWATKLAIRLKEYGIVEQIPDQVIVNEYKPGQGISSHVDCEPCFGDTVLSLSLSSVCVMDFTNIITRMKVDAVLDPRSILCMKGDARYKWLHGIVPRLADNINGVRINRKTRVSMTFRKVII